MAIEAQEKVATQWQLLLTAIMFYTRIPVPANLPYSEQFLNQSRAYFPAIGLIIGALGALSFLPVSYTHLTLPTTPYV